MEIFFFLAVFMSAHSFQVFEKLIFSFQVSNNHSDIPLINPSIFHNATNEDAASWRILKLHEKSYINSKTEAFVVWGANSLHIVRPHQPEVVASCRGLRGLHDVAVTEAEIFVLEGESSIKISLFVF